MGAKVIFDQFSTRGILKENLSGLNDLLEGLDIEILTFSGTMSGATFAVGDAFVIPGKDNTSYTVSEKYKILDFVENGGILVVFSGKGGDTAFNSNLNEILSETGIELANNMVKGEGGDYSLKLNLRDHPVTQGISEVMFPASCSLLCSGKNVQIIGETGKKASPPAAPLIAETTYENGKIAVFGSWRFVSNNYIEKFENKKLLKYLFAYLLKIQVEKPKEKEKEVKKREEVEREVKEEVKAEKPVQKAPSKQKLVKEEKQKISIPSLEERLSSLEQDMKELKRMRGEIKEIERKIKGFAEISKLSEQIEELREKIDHLVEERKTSVKVQEPPMKSSSRVNKKLEEINDKMENLGQLNRLSQDTLKSLMSETRESKSLLEKLQGTKGGKNLSKTAPTLKEEITKGREELKRQRKEIEELRNVLEDVKEGLTHLLLDE